MNIDRITQEVENAMVRLLKNDKLLDIPYGSRIDVSKEMKEAYNNVNYEKVKIRITEVLEEELAKKIVNKVITEMGTDIKKLMSNETIREDFRFFMRKGVEKIMKIMGENE